LLNRNWLISFSSTTADCVRRSVSPCLEHLARRRRLEPDVLLAEQPEVRILSGGVARELVALVDVMATTAS
jgi:hypothetical protein